MSYTSIYICIGVRMLASSNVLHAGRRGKMAKSNRKNENNRESGIMWARGYFHIAEISGKMWKSDPEYPKHKAILDELQ